jgi:hypothetical protein
MDRNYLIISHMLESRIRHGRMIPLKGFFVILDTASGKAHSL